jgi:hypothetical protein
MIEVKLTDTTVEEMLVIVKDLRDRGYIQHTDFDFTYHPPKFDNISGHPVYNRCVVFKFYKDEVATWFSLVYP